VTPIFFEKMHANGDDFVVVDLRDGGPPLSGGLVRRFADRQRGIGFNQIATVSECGDAAAAACFWNADGTPLNTCGSAMRGIALKLMLEIGTDTVMLRTRRGLSRCVRQVDGLISVDMGAPLFHWTDIPLMREMDTGWLPLVGDPAACSMGNPHCTFFVEDVDQVEIEAWGRDTETHPLFPSRTNVHFVQVLNPSRIRLRIWERGAGISPASGSCACAAVVNGIRRGLLSQTVEVQCDGGLLSVCWDGAGAVRLAGPVEPLFRGEWRPGLTTPEPLQALGLLDRAG
jgi:diaminopimelate epimerase